MASDPQAANEQFAAMQAQYQQQMQQVMTPQQWQAWTQMTGEPYSFPQTAFFPQDDGNVSVAQRPRLDTSLLRNRGTQQQNARPNVPQQQNPPQNVPQQQDQSLLRNQGAQQQNAPQQSGQQQGTSQQGTVR